MAIKQTLIILVVVVGLVAYAAPSNNQNSSNQNQNQNQEKQVPSNQNQAKQAQSNQKQAKQVQANQNQANPNASTQDQENEDPSTTRMIFDLASLPIKHSINAFQESLPIAGKLAKKVPGYPRIQEATQGFLQNELVKDSMGQARKVYDAASGAFQQVQPQIKELQQQGQKIVNDFDAQMKSYSSQQSEETDSSNEN